MNYEAFLAILFKKIHKQTKFSVFRETFMDKVFLVSVHIAQPVSMQNNNKKVLQVRGKKWVIVNKYLYILF